MFKKSYLFGLILVVTISTSLMGADAPPSSDDEGDTGTSLYPALSGGSNAYKDDEKTETGDDGDPQPAPAGDSSFKKLKDFVSPYIASGAEEASAIARLALVCSIKNTKNCGKTKKVLTDLARIINEGLAYYNKVKPAGLPYGMYNYASYTKYLSLFSLALAFDDFYEMGGHIFKSKKKSKNGEIKSDDRLKGFFGFFDNKIFPLVEGLAAVARGGGDIAVDHRNHTDSQYSNKFMKSVASPEFNEICTGLIIASRLLSKLLNSEVGSVELKYTLALGIIVGLIVLHDYYPEVFEKAQKAGTYLARNPLECFKYENWPLLLTFLFPKKNARE